MELLVVVGIALVVVLVYMARKQRRQREIEAERRRELAMVTAVAEEDVTQFGEELRELDVDTMTTTLNTAMRQDYQRAINSYEAAKKSLTQVHRSRDVSHVTEALEDGRYAAACVLARRDGRDLPIRRPPCFFNPQHGPSISDVEWAPPGGIPRKVPVCSADEDRLSRGAEPDIRMVPDGDGRVPYWQGGPAYTPYAYGWYGNYAMSGLLPSFLLLGVLSGTDGGLGMDDGGGFDGGGDAGGGDFGGGDSGGFGDGGGFGDFGGGGFGDFGF